MRSGLSVNLESVVLQYFEDLGTSFSLKCAILWRYGEFEALLSLKCDPGDYADALSYLRAVSALAFVKKLKGVIPNADARRARALEKWEEGEQSCYKTNQRLAPYLCQWQERDERIYGFLRKVRKIVGELIGYGPPPLLEGRHGPGATFSDRGVRATVPHKMSSKPTLTRDAIWFLPQFFGTAWGRSVALGEGVSVVRGNRFTTAPKTSLVDRSIAVEPSINVFYQLAIGRALRSCLRQIAGWDLDTAQEVHRAVAREASLTREFATLDLSNASDTVARNLVKLLLPRGWFDVLDDLRSKMTRVPAANDPKGRWRVLEKFSSMGNGFTFELETVLFAALSIAATRENGHMGVLGKDVFVFGDDIIVRDDVVHDVTALLNFCGFSLNKEKSFSGMSPFRESCGADFYVGADVRPSYLKEDPQDVMGAVGVANRIMKTLTRVKALRGSMPSRAWQLALSFIPVRYRLFGPEGLGDQVVWSEPERWRIKWRHSIRYVKGLKAGDRVVIPYADFKPDVVLACATYGAGNVGTPDKGRIPVIEGVHPRDCIRSYVVGWLAYS